MVLGIRSKISPNRQYVLFCRLVPLSYNHSPISLHVRQNQSPSPALRGKSSLCYIDRLLVLWLQAFCQVLVLSNHTIHLSRSFRLQLLINNKPIRRAKWTTGSLSSRYVLSRKRKKNSIRSAAQEHHTEHENETWCAKCVEKNNFRDRKSSGGVGRMSFSHEGADIFCVSQ